MADSTATGTTVGTTLALKEWAAVAHALLEGRQSILLRKGGIHERAFGVEDARFVLFPTVEHSHRERVRPGHARLLDRGAADVSGDRLTIRCAVDLVDTVTAEAPDPDHLPGLTDLHIYTDDHAEERLAFRPHHPLHVLVVRARPLVEPVTLARREEFGGCRSWLELPLEWDGALGDPALPDAELERVARRVREALA